MNGLHVRQYIFAEVFHLANELQKYLDRHLAKDDLTGKQFMLMIVLGSFKEQSASLKDLALKAGSSYQNVKKMALGLERQGYMKVEKDQKDRRTNIISMTEKAMVYWKDRDESDIKRIFKLFDGIDEGDLEVTARTIGKIMVTLEGMDHAE